MSGELDRYQPEPGSLVTWAEEARSAHQIAESLARTSFVPKAMQGHPEEVTAAILTGRELGLKPMAALKSIHIIEGTPSLSAAGMRGVAQSHGHLVWVEESSDTRAVVCGRREGTTITERVVWTIDRARKANLAGKQVWQRHPAAMLVARATSEVARRVAADALLGMPYSTEEITDHGGTELAEMDAAPEPVAPADKPKPRTLKRAAPPAVAAAPAQQDDEPAGGSPPELPAQPEPQPELDADVVAEPEPDPEPPPEPPMTEPQKRALMAVYRKSAGDRDERIAHASSVLGRDVTSFNELTKREAMVLLDALVEENEDPQ